MNFEDLQEIEQHGFGGFAPVADLQASACREIPAEPGVYLILRLDKTPPQFLPQSIGGHHKGKDPTVPIAVLQSKWVEGPIVVYIGSTKTLKKRLSTYMKYGQGKPVGHEGGCYIWQLTDSADLRVCWKPTPGEDPRKVEQSLIAEFTAKHGKRPFANRQD